MEEKPEELKINFGVLIFLILLFVSGFVVLVGLGSKPSLVVTSSPEPESELKINLGQSESKDNQNQVFEDAKKSQEVTELKVEDIKVGDGVEAKEGKKLTVHYSGTLLDGTEFDSSYERGESFSFNLGQAQVIKGWDQGLVGMRVGGKRKLIIPPQLGYGSRKVGKIPPNSTLVFEVELLSVE